MAPEGSTLLLACGEIQDIIETHKTDLDMDNPEDLIDFFLINMEKDMKVNYVNIEEEEEKLRTLVIDIFMVSINVLLILHIIKLLIFIYSYIFSFSSNSNS